ncbi:glycosyltransferase family 4 protein [Halorubellus salinus]|uniref:glycosyltransferase family 4 protein n=1 Tax=Halorubellus salinus TaxID=755309 RepID=UPI001D074C14|nr:glycosyltransferase family 4 protein [Halorubellus salinus]
MTSICVLSTVHDPLNTRVYHKEAKAASNAGYDVTMVAHDPPENHEGAVEFLSLGQAETRYKRWAHLPRAYTIARSLNSDIYHFHDPELLPIGVMLQRTTNAHVIYDAHEDYAYNAIEYREWIPGPIRPAISKTFPLIQSAFANRLDRVITTTESIAEQFIQFGHENVEVIHNYPKTENISIGRPPIKQSKEITLVYVGSFEHIHGLMPMLHLVRELSDRGASVELWMLGSFNEGHHERSAKEFIDNHNLQENIHFVGRIPYEDIFSYLNCADLGLCLVDQKRCEHALPTKIFEYMYSKTPVVATDAQSIRPYISREVGRLVSQTDPEGQADAIEELISDSTRLEKMGNRGRELVEERYNWEQEADLLVSIYESLL